jgi:hypothetical protein
MAWADTAPPAGNIGEIQYHAADDTLRGISNLYYDTSLGLGIAGNISINQAWDSNYTTGIFKIGNVDNLQIIGGNVGEVLTKGSGNTLLFQTMTSGPAGSNTQIQFNDDSVLAGNANLTFNKTTGTLTALKFSGNGNALSSLNGANVIGQVSNAALAGAVYLNAQSNITSLGTLTSLTVAGTTTIQQAKEKVYRPPIALSGTVNFDLLDQAIVFSSSSSANFTLNIRGNGTTTLNSVMSNLQSMTCTLVNPITTYGYYANVIQIDGATQAVNWNGNAPSYTTISGSAKDVYTFNIIKTGSNVYTILGSAGRFI